jgi:hypothetical protein
MSIVFNKIVQKMWTKWWKILFKNDIFDIIDPEKKSENINKLNKIIYKLKSDNIIISIKSWVYIVPLQDDKKLNKIDLIEKYYFKLLKKYITYYVWNFYYIWWMKALEIHNKNYSVWNKIYIINRNLTKKIKFWNYEIIFKTISWKNNWKKINLYNRFSVFVDKKSIEWYDFKVANLELALLEASLISDIEEGFDYSIINKTLKKYWDVLNKDIFYEIWKYKYIMAFNRLKELSKHINNNLYLVFLDIIKRNWALFIWEWLRWI